ncbi:MAG: hypothetical protein JO372_17645 [Solirubrobacterales bacterium]|nr:hypothetical protein [Solirubrobacterales bacterium]
MSLLVRRGKPLFQEEDCISIKPVKTRVRMGIMAAATSLPSPAELT